MIVETTIEVGGIKVTVRELTVAEIRAMIEAAAVLPATDALQELLFDDFRATDLKTFTDLDDARMEGLKPSELRSVWERVEKVNADFFALRRRLNAVAVALAPQDGAIAPEASSAPPSP